MKSPIPRPVLWRIVSSKNRVSPATSATRCNRFPPPFTASAEYPACGYDLCGLFLLGHFALVIVRTVGVC